jgi:retinol dehydrogenase 12
MVGLRSAVFPPAPTFTEENLPSQYGKVFIITGAASGVGFELAKMLYAKDGTVFIAARTNKRATDAISRIKTEVRKSTGRLEPMAIDLADLPSIKPAVEAFLQRENRLDVLVHNAGVMEPPTGSKTKQVRECGPLIPPTTY